MTALSTVGNTIRKFLLWLLAACLRRDPKNRPTATQARRVLRDLTPKLSSVSFPLGAPSSSPATTGAAAVSASRLARAESA